MIYPIKIFFLSSTLFPIKPPPKIIYALILEAFKIFKKFLFYAFYNAPKIFKLLLKLSLVDNLEGNLDLQVFQILAILYEFLNVVFFICKTVV